MKLWRRLMSLLHGQTRSSSLGKQTVRYMFPALMGSAAVFGLLALSGASSDSYVFLSTPTPAIETGDVFSVAVYAAAAVPVNAVEMKITFPEDKLEVFGVDRGQSVLTIWTEDPVITDTSVTLRGGTFKRGFLGDHLIATINFRAETTGQYMINTEDIRLVAGDGEGTEVPASVVPATNLSLFNFDEDTSEAEIRVAVQERVKTDLNNDGRVTLQDISAFMGVWSSRSQTLDFNGDGRMTFRDFSIILAEFFFQ